MSRKLLIILALTAFGSAVAADLPETIALKGAKQPFWISASAATDEHGSIRWSAFDTANRHLIEAEMKRMEARAAERHVTQKTTATEPCPEITLQTGGGHGLDRSWNDLRANSRAVYVGTITAARQGFLWGIVSTLYELRVEKTIRVTPGYPAGESLYFGYPAADFTLGGTRFCNAGPRHSVAPAVGDRVLLFAFDPAVDPAELFVPTKASHLFFAHDGALVVPAQAAGDSTLPSPLSFEALERAAEEQRTPHETEVRP